MTVAITGASGNVGTALLRRLATAGVGEIRGLARRRPPEAEPYDGVRWFSADLSTPDSEPVLAEFLDGVDAVVHLAWALIPDRQPDVLHAVNVEGTRRVLAAGALPFLGTFAALLTAVTAADLVAGRVPADRAVTVIRPSREESRYLTALSSRLPNTCSTARRSATIDGRSGAIVTTAPAASA